MTEMVDLIKWGWKYIRPFFKSIIIFNVIGFVASLATLLEPEISRMLIDSMTNPNRQAFFVYLLMIVFLQVINLGLTQFAKIIKIRQDIIINRSMETSVVQDYLKKKKLFDKGHTITLFKQDLPAMLQIYKSMIPNIVISTILFVIIAIRLVYINAVLLIVSLTFSIIPTLIVRFTGKKLSESNKRQTIIQDKYNTFISDLPSATLDSQSKESNELFSSKLNEILSESFKELWTYNKVQIFSTIALTLISILGMLITYLILGHMIFFQDFSYGRLFSILMYNGLLTSKINSIINTFQSLLTYQYSLERLKEFFSDNNFVNIKYDKESLSKEIEIKDLCFSYNQTNLILSHFNLSLKYPSLVLLKGKNGSGKSTLINILSGILPLADKNSICFKGYDKDDIYTLFQTSKTYPFSIRDNICMGRENYYKNDKHHLIKNININSEKVFEISDPLALSKGQEKRVVFDRMLYQDKEVMLIDEVDSPIDKEGKDEIGRILNYLKRDHIIFIAVHHDAYDDFADKIVTLD